MAFRYASFISWSLTDSSSSASSAAQPPEGRNNRREAAAKAQPRRNRDNPDFFISIVFISSLCPLDPHERAKSAPTWAQSRNSLQVNDLRKSGEKRSGSEGSRIDPL